MDERKSVISSQAVENLEQDFQFDKGVTENAGYATIKQYNRDILLQLRFHPLCLQKPQELPELEVIKDKLYLHGIIDMASTSSEKCVDMNNYQSSVKPDYGNVKSEYHLLSPYFNRIHPYCYSSHTYNKPYQSIPMKYRSAFPTYCNPLKKHCVPNHQCFKEVSTEECPWTKHFTPSDDMWNCYSSQVSGSYKRKENLEAVPKCRKILPIIDPATGKNVLENVQPNGSEENDASSIEENSQLTENHVDEEQDKDSGDYFCSAKRNSESVEHKPNEDHFDSTSFSSGDKMDLEAGKDSNAEFQADISVKSMKNLSQDTQYSTSITDGNKNTESIEKVESTSVKNNVFELPKASERTHATEIPRYNKPLNKTSHHRETNTYFDAHGTCQAHFKRDCQLHSCRDSISKHNGTMQENLRQLREKIYSLKQEEQKIAILQSFLRYKKYQLEESARSLDEKRIEIANWEYNLYNKAKKLQEKEQWLENKNEMLSKKTQMAEKEKMLNEEEKIPSESLFSKNAFKEVHAPEEKATFGNNDVIWDEIPNIKNSKTAENNEYSFTRYGSKPTNVPEITSSNVEKCKIDAYSLDELEKNLVFIEKMHSSSDVTNNAADKIELVSPPNAAQKSDENASFDPLGYSKGRRYLPEHIKYWLDKRDKSAL